MTPIWLGQLMTGAKSFGDNPILGSRRLNELGLHAGRVALAHKLATWRRARLAHLISDADRRDFERDGFVIKRNLLAPDAFEALVAQVKAYRGPVRETVQGDALTRRIALDRTVLGRIPAARDLLRMPAWRGLVRYVGSADAEPVVYLQTILSHVVEGAQPDPQLALHADTFHPSVKAWLFLTDVPEDDGPFVYVPGSHRASERRLAWERRISVGIHDQDRLTRRGSFRVDAAVLEELGLPPPRACAVPANTLVVADTFGFHARGASAHPSLRVEVWAYGRRSPFLPWVGLDPWRIPALGNRRAGWFWSAGDAIEASGGPLNVWRLRAEASAFDPLIDVPQFPVHHLRFPWR
ncbi:MAG TPA: phytanoyl-CoA dioxygenase family protein [Candidatus Sulfotelmatobacter sp.]|nr:phytanoyl-CoA dioxygenase family protein [Candidatus Sulfotelmatobacter sp.]